jgi:putative copper export protein
VLCGVSWVGACGSLVLASMTLADQAGDVRDFMRRSAPRINLICIICACLIPVTGLANLTFVARDHRFALPTEFVGIVGIKIVLFAVMGGTLWLVVRRCATLSREPNGVSDRGDLVDPAVSGLVRLYRLTIAAGAAALAMGLWLSGV